MVHTPGPWRWFNYPDGRKLLCAHNRAVVHCPDAPMLVESADADLIAAAPDLLDALTLVLPLAERYLAKAATHPDNAKLETARGAIAKAVRR